MIKVSKHKPGVNQSVYMCCVVKFLSNVWLCFADTELRNSPDPRLWFQFCFVQATFFQIWSHCPIMRVKTELWAGVSKNLDWSPHLFIEVLTADHKPNHDYMRCCVEIKKRLRRKSCRVGWHGSCSSVPNKWGKKHNSRFKEHYHNQV